MKNTLFKLGVAALCACAAASATYAAKVGPSHQARGIACEACHTTMPQANYNNCIACHGGKERLIESVPQHEALKSGDVPCRICHQGHR